MITSIYLKQTFPTVKPDGDGVEMVWFAINFFHCWSNSIRDGILVDTRRYLRPVLGELELS